MKYVTRMHEIRKAYKFLIAKPIRYGLLGRPKPDFFFFFHGLGYACSVITFPSIFSWESHWICIPFSGILLFDSVLLPPEFYV
jgi:hypothetical protein